MRRRVHGVDFSGAADAGRRIWVASGVAEAGGLRIDACRPAAALPGGGRERAAALGALRALVAAETESVFGCDFPFSLPLALVPEGEWEPFALCFGERYADPLSFRRACWEAAGGRELWRQTDRETKTPFPATNLRICRQTFHGIRDLLAPLVREERACVLPMQRARSGRAWLLEICPAVTLKQHGLYTPYKGGAPGRREARSRILAAFEREGGLRPADPELRALLCDDPGGDALDAVLAAVTAAAVIGREGALLPPDGPYAREGYVYRAPREPESPAGEHDS
jgi:hypothetical protein